MTRPPTSRRALWRRPLLSLIAFAAVMGVPVPVPVGSRIVLAYTLSMALQCAILLRIMVGVRREDMMGEAHLHASRSWIPDVVAGVLSIASIAMLIYLSADAAIESTALRTAHIFISLIGVVLTWMVMNGTFALRYATVYYAPTPGAPDQPRGGLRFPDDDLVPDYWDFLYYAFTIGMCYQTSDISLASPEMRGQTLLHAIFAFLYVCGILSMLFGIVGSSL